MGASWRLGAKITLLGAVPVVWPSNQRIVAGAAPLWLGSPMGRVCSSTRTTKALAVVVASARLCAIMHVIACFSGQLYITYIVRSSPGRSRPAFPSGVGLFLGITR